jgi:hypothetical protein
LVIVVFPQGVRRDAIRIGPYFTLHAFKVRQNQGGGDIYLNYTVGLPMVILRAHFELAQVWSGLPVYQVFPYLEP